MKKIFLFSVILLLLCGCGKKSVDVSYIDRQCCTDVGGVYDNNRCNSSEIYSGSEYKSCTLYVDENAKQCCLDFGGHWNDYNKICKLSSGDESMFKDCIDDYNWFDDYLNDKYKF